MVDLWANMKSLTLETVTQASFSLPLGLMDEAAAAKRSVRPSVHPCVRVVVIWVDSETTKRHLNVHTTRHTHSKYDGPRIFALLQAASAALSDATFSPLPTSINPAFKYVCGTFGCSALIV